MPKDFEGNKEDYLLKKRTRRKIFKRLVDLYIFSAGLEYADVLHYPYECSLLEQPERTLHVWMAAREAHVSFNVKKNEEAMNKVKSKKR